MGEPVNIFLGFDPGGEGRFGWSICQQEANQLGRLCSGNASDAKEAISIVLNRLLPAYRVVAAGIDAPLFWSNTGRDRVVDRAIRRRLPAAVQGQQQAVNKSSVISIRGRSMWSGLLIQGALLRDLLHREFRISITESHPRVLDYLDPGMRGQIRRLPPNVHERDSTFAAYAAWRMHQKVHGHGAANWNDLLPLERCPKFPLLTVSLVSTGYWMPNFRQELRQRHP